MALADNIALRTQDVTLAVRINGVLLAAADPTSSAGVPGVGAVRVQKSFSSPVPVCTIEMNRVPNWIRRGHPVTVDAGYNGLVQRIFTGYVQSRNRRVGSGGINALGKLWSAFRTIEIEERSVDGMTVEEAIEAILDDVGITDRALTIPAFTLGTASTPKLERMPASQMLQMLMDIDGCRIYELGTGQTIIRVIEEFPAGTSFRTFSTDTAATARIIDVSDSEDPDYFRDYISVIGATVVEGTAPDQTSRTITANATLLGSGLVQPPLPSGTQIEAEYNNHLIDTDAKAAEVAARLLNRYARVPKQLVATVVGDPQLELGQTITMSIPEMDIDSRFFVSSIEHSISRSGFVTTLRDLRGGDELGGTLAQNPIAAFLFHTEREIVGNAQNVVATFNATGSFDPDGGDYSALTFAWSDNQFTTPEASTITSAIWSCRADTSAWTGDWLMSCTVTDPQSLTHTVTIKIPYENDTVDTIPSVYAALENNASATLDGGTTWNDEAGSTCISTAARPADGVNVGHALYGFSDGHIARTTDGAQTLTTVLAAVGSPINCIAWDWRNTNVAWAITSDMRLYISVDAGVTWVLYDALRTTLSLAGAIAGRRAIGLPADGGVYVFGGTGAGHPLIAFDPVVGSHGWVNQTLLGDIATDLVTPADATMRIVDFTSPGNGISVMILEFASGGGASIQPIYTSTSSPGPSATYTRATGLTAGLKTGRYVVGDDPRSAAAFHAAFADQDVWDSADGIAWTQKAGVMPAGVTPNDALFMSDVLSGVPDMQGVYLVAAQNAGATVGIYKSSDGLTTVSSFRPSTIGTALPAGAKGRYVSVGAPGATLGVDAVFVQQSINTAVASSHARRVATLQGGSVWTNTANPSAASQAGVTKLRRFNGVMFRIIAQVLDEGASSNPAGQLQRSIDDGANWSNVGPSPVGPISLTYWGITDIKRGADGTLWAVACTSGSLSGDAGFPAPTLYKSIDDGATWTAKYTDSTKDSSVWRRFIALAPHPLNPDILVIVGDRGLRAITTWHSTDATASSPTFTPHTGFGTSTSDEVRAVMLTSGRLISLISTTGIPRYSDDYGVTWTVGSSLFGTRQYALIRTGSSDALFAIGGASGSAKLYRCLDLGATWTQVLDDSGMDVGINAFNGLDYSQTTGKLYLATDSVAAAERVFSIADPLTAAAPFTPSDISYNLDSLWSGIADRLGMDCLAVEA